MANPIVALTTDFGVGDPYVGEMKGVILSINSKCAIVDLCHEVEAQSILQGAFLLAITYHYLPRGTIHVAVVDPGVGTSRRALLVLGNGHIFLVPDNGLLSYVSGEDQQVGPQLEPLEGYQRPLPDGWQAFALTNSKLWRHPVSATFHGRDIFASVAAHLSLGLSPAEVGEAVDSIQCLYLPMPRWREGVLEGRVTHIDRFGNLITDISNEEVASAAGGITVDVGKRLISGLSPYYDVQRELLALMGSHGYLEISASRGNAAARLGMAIGAPVVVRLG